jgi:hypothetical protein
LVLFACSPSNPEAYEKKDAEVTRALEVSRPG